MLKNHFTVAFRNLVKHKSFSVINIFGLALGISLCLVLITVIKDQLSFDTFHPDRDRIFRINTEAIRKDGGTEKYASAPFPLGTELKANYPYIENVVQLSNRTRKTVSFDKKQLSLEGFFTGDEFFEVFGFDLLYGDKAIALNEPGTIVISQKASEKFFGNENPVGKILTISELDNFKITGVVKTPPAKTHLEFDMLISNSALATYEKEEKVFPLISNWLNYYTNYNYVLLKDKANAGELENALESISKKRYANVTLESRDKAYHFYLQPLNKIIPGPMLSNNLGKALPSQLLWVIGVFALIVLSSAGFNYNSLSVAKSLSRAKEIGVRKVSGALRHHLIFQFLTESVFTSLLAFVMAGVLFHFFLKPFFLGLGIFHDLNVELGEDVSLYISFAIFCMVVGIATGIFPALYLSSFNALQSMKATKGKLGTPKLGFRKVLLISQFAAALLFVITLININRQVNYVMNADYGLRKDNIINVDLQRNNFEKVKHAFAQNSNVVSVSGISHSLGTWNDRSIDVRVNASDEKIAVRDYTIDNNYINNLGLKLIAGKNFSDNLPSNRELNVIVNENFVKSFKLGTPSEALNKSIILGDSIQVVITGVVKDFHFKPFTYTIEPLLLRYNLSDIYQLNVQLNGINNKKTIAQLDKTWKSIDQTQPFTYKYFNNELRDTYSDFKDINHLIGVVAFMAVVVACLWVFRYDYFTGKATRKRNKYKARVRSKRKRNRDALIAKFFVDTFNFKCNRLACCNNFKQRTL